MSDPNQTLPGGEQQAGEPQPRPPAGEPAASQPARETAPHPRPPVGEHAAPQPVRETAPHPLPAVPQKPPPPVQIGGNVGGDVAGRDLHKELKAGRDIVGRDVVTNTTTTNVGFSFDAVQRLLLTVGALVAATAACFFVLGGVSAAGIVAAINRPGVSNNQSAAESFAADLAALRALPPGQPYEFSFSEEEISSYFHLVVEPNALQGQVSQGKVRLLDSGQLVIAGRADQLGGVPFAATFAPQKDTPGAPLRMTGVLLDIVPLGNSPLGWVSVPTGALQPLAAMLNSLFGNVALQDVRPLPDGHAWDVTVVGH